MIKIIIKDKKLNNIACKAQFFCPNILRVALRLLGLKAGSKDKSLPACPNPTLFTLVKESAATFPFPHRTLY